MISLAGAPWLGGASGRERPQQTRYALNDLIVALDLGVFSTHGKPLQLEWTEEKTEQLISSVCVCVCVCVWAQIAARDPHIRFSINKSMDSTFN